MTDDAPVGQTSRGTLGTVRNATLLLDLLSEGAPLQHLRDLAEKSGYSLPTVHRLLRSLQAAGLVALDPKSLRYGLGPELVRLSERYLMRLPVLRALAPYLVALRDGEATRAGETWSFTAFVASARPVRLRRIPRSPSSTSG